MMNTTHQKSHHFGSIFNIGFGYKSQRKSIQVATFVCKYEFKAWDLMYKSFYASCLYCSDIAL